MSKLNWAKASRVEVWRQSERNAWSGQLPDASPRATDKQLKYLAVLMARNGRRPHTAEEIALLTTASASRLIKSLETAWVS